jgi:hypothetical protein
MSLFIRIFKGTLFRRKIESGGKRTPEEEADMIPQRYTIHIYM